MTETQDKTVAPERRRPLRWPAVVAVLILAGLMGTAAWIVWINAHAGDPYGPFPRIENRTNEAVVVFLEELDGRRFEIITVPPHSAIDLPSKCAAAEYVAVGEDGDVVSRRPRSNGCNLQDWVIDGPSDG